MKTTLFPREEHTQALFREILKDPSACERLQDTFCESLNSNDEIEGVSAKEFAEALFQAYTNQDLSAFLIIICQNTTFDLLRNAFLIPYRFDADGITNPVIMTDNCGALLPEFPISEYEKEYRHFREAFHVQGCPENMFLAQAHRYSHAYGEDHMNVVHQVLEKHTGVLLIRELPDSVKKKETEAEVYAAVWNLMIQIEKSLPMSFVFYGQDSLTDQNERYDELGIFLPNSIFLKELEKHIAKAEAIIHEYQ